MAKKIEQDADLRSAAQRLAEIAEGVREGNGGNGHSKTLGEEVIPLPVRLTDDELRDSGVQLAKGLEALSRMESEFESQKQVHKGEVALVEEDIARLAKTIRDRSEYRPVRVTEVADFEAGTATRYREDTGEALKTF